jgi:hypothetical protein
VILLKISLGKYVGTRRNRLSWAKILCEGILFSYEEKYHGAMTVEITENI